MRAGGAGGGGAIRSIPLAALGMLVAALLLVACGGEDERSLGPHPTLPGGPPRTAIAAVVNRMQEAFVAGDGESACALMSGRGQELVRRVARRTGMAPEAEDCVEAVAGVAASPESDGTIDPVRPADVSIGPTQLPGAGPGRDVEPGSAAARRYAEVVCEFRGSYGLRKIGEDWRVFVPICFD